MESSMSLCMALNTFRRLYRNQTYCSYKRFLSLSVQLKAEAEHAVTTDTMVDETKQEKKMEKKELTRAKFSTMKENYILKFFNECDQVTIGKFIQLISFKKETAELRANLKEVFDKNLCERKVTFENIDDLINKTSMDPKNFPDIYAKIRNLALKEIHSFGLPGMTPVFPMKRSQHVNYVVAIDLIVNNLSWAVMKTDRELVDVGQKQLFYKQYNYHPVKHHEMITDILENLPPSMLYVQSSRIPTTSGKTKVSWYGYQMMMEAMLKLALNHRMKLMLNNDKNVGANTGGNQLENFVYHIKPSDINLFYDVLVHQEMKDLEPIYKQWLNENRGPFRNMRMSPTVDLSDISDDTIKCIMMAELTCRCINKWKHKFPSAYFPPLK